MKLVGVEEVAARLGVKTGTVYKWRERSKPGARQRLPVPMPEPKLFLGGSPAWSWFEIQCWATQTGRAKRPVSNQKRNP